MKNLYLMLLMFVSFYSSSQGLSTEPKVIIVDTPTIEETIVERDTSKSDSIDKYKEEINKLQQDLSKVLKILKEDKDTSIVIGDLYLMTSVGDILSTYYTTKANAKMTKKEFEKYKKRVNLKRSFPMDSNKIKSVKNYKKLKYYNNAKNNVIKKIKLEKVIVIFENGVIKHIKVYCEGNRIFTNEDAPISLDRVNKGEDNLSFLSKEDGNKYWLKLSDVIRFDEIVNSFPTDDILVFDTTVSRLPLHKSTDINSLINLRLFTDVLGLLGQQSNGLAQTELDFKIPLHRKNRPNKYKYLFSDLFFKAQLSRFDSKFKSTKVDTINNTFERHTFNQRKWFNMELGISVFTCNFFKRSENSLSIDIIGGINVSNFSNSVDSFRYALPYYGINPKIHLSTTKNFGMNIYLRTYLELFPEQQSEGYGKVKLFFSPDIEIYYNPIGNTQNRLFARFAYTTLTQTRGSYFNIQLGYTLSISDLINKK